MSNIYQMHLSYYYALISTKRQPPKHHLTIRLELGAVVDTPAEHWAQML